MIKLVGIFIEVCLLFNFGYGQIEFHYKEKLNIKKMILLDSLNKKINIINELANINPSKQYKKEDISKYLKDNEINFISIIQKYEKEYIINSENVTTHINDLSFNEDEKKFLKEITNQPYSDNVLTIQDINNIKMKLENERNTSSNELEKIEDDKKTTTLDILNSGFLDIFKNGTSKGTTQLFKLRISELGIPVYLYVAAKGNSLSNEKPNQKEESFYDLVDPLGGMLNAHFYDSFTLVQSNLKMTYLGFVYQVGVKLMNGEQYQIDNNNNINNVLINTNKIYFNAFGSLGLSFQTSAWDTADPDNMGMFWIQARLTGNLLSQKRLGEIFGDNTMNGFFLGFAGEIGLLIKNRINLKFGVFKYFSNNTNPALEFIRSFVYKLSLDYSLSK